MSVIRFLRGIIKPYIIVFKHAISKPHTIKYPYERLMFSDGYRGRISLRFEKCIGCGLCSRTCPNRAIEMVEIEGEKHSFPQINFGRCSFCCLCVDVCPRGALFSDEVVELSVIKRDDLIYHPYKLSNPQPLESILKDLKKTITVQIEDGRLSYTLLRRREENV